MTRSVYSIVFSHGHHDVVSGVDAYAIWTVPVDGNTYVLRHLLFTVQVPGGRPFKLWWTGDVSMPPGLVVAELDHPVDTEDVTVEQDCHMVLTPGIGLIFGVGPASIDWNLSGYKLTPT